MLRTLVMGLGLAAFAAFGAQAAPVQDRYSSFWVFGDSLSDPGNLFVASGGTAPASPPYFDGRFSNGPVWAEHVAESFGAAGKPSGNFAYGGATAVTNADMIPDLFLQTGIYAATAAPFAGDRPLASLFFGANDILDNFAAAAISANPIVAIGSVAVAAARAVGAGATTLATFGVGDFAIWNLPDIGLTPRFAEFLPPQAQALASFASATFNAELDLVIADLRAGGLKVTEIDTVSLFNATLADPDAFGFTDVSLPCLFPDATTAAAFGQPLLCDPADAETKLYFDSIHPTALAHTILAETFVATVPVPLPATGLLLVAALGTLALRRRAA